MLHVHLYQGILQVRTHDTNVVLLCLICFPKNNNISMLLTRVSPHKTRQAFSLICFFCDHVPQICMHFSFSSLLVVWSYEGLSKQKENIVWIRVYMCCSCRIIWTPTWFSECMFWFREPQGKTMCGAFFGVRRVLYISIKWVVQKILLVELWGRTRALLLTHVCLKVMICLTSELNFLNPYIQIITRGQLYAKQPFNSVFQSILTLKLE